LLIKLPNIFSGAILSAIILVGCTEYSFKVNNRLVYSPAPLFSDFLIKDQALNECVKQHINTQRITAAAQMITLNCVHAGIQNLSGLEQFSGLQGIKLSHNAIKNISPLTKLSQLRELYLDHNQVSKIDLLTGLTRLKKLDLKSNPELICSQVKRLTNLETLIILTPFHCK
tara:strand:- start:1488 stop:2000 length:513 start_codon:yes stop_codon:yes gene_type:complete